MSHDRDCFQCGRDRWEYKSCTQKDCPKLKWVLEDMWEERKAQIELEELQKRINMNIFEGK